MTQKFSITAQIEEVEIELKFRSEVFPRLIRSGKMRQSEADYRTERMKAALESLNWLKDNRPAIVEYIRNKPPKKDAAA